MSGYILAILGYTVCVGAGIRFFQTVRMWDEEARCLIQKERFGRKPVSKLPVRHRKPSAVSKRTVLQD